MKLGKLKKLIESLPDGKKFNRSLSDPFSWRGSYDEVAFSIEEVAATKEEMLDKITKAFTQEFCGYKGGEYRYNGQTPVNFEADESDYSDGSYTDGWISMLLNIDPAESNEERLVKLLFQ